jgi:zinc D-Ala-D-Ala dipeptidase
VKTYSCILLFILFLFSHHLVCGQETMVNLSTFPSEFDFEIRYATTENFMHEKLYDCAVCLLQPEVGRALADANDYFCELGYRIKIYDCYRPLDVQKRMWQLFPNATYVANPYEGGSVHNRGAAVDITLVTLEGCYVEMGSDYDFFGQEAHIDHTHFPPEVLAHRKLFLEGMRRFGFQPVRTEWWHFSYQRNYAYSISNLPLPCD